MSGGIMSVASAIRAIGLSATATARAVEAATEAVREYGETASRTTTSRMGVSGSDPTGGMGASAGSGSGNASMTTRGMATAISIARRSL
jgi:hypothetical protein